MNYNFVISSEFARKFKKLAKKYPSLKDDFINLGFAKILMVFLDFYKKHTKNLTIKVLRKIKT